MDIEDRGASFMEATGLHNAPRDHRWGVGLALDMMLRGAIPAGRSVWACRGLPVATVLVERPLVLQFGPWAVWVREDRIDALELRTDIPGRVSAWVTRGPYHDTEVELLDGRVWAHNIVKTPWTKETRRVVLEESMSALDRVGYPIFATSNHPHAGDVEKHRKFVERLGFRLAGATPSGQAIYMKE